MYLFSRTISCISPAGRGDKSHGDISEESAAPRHSVSSPRIFFLSGTSRTKLRQDCTEADGLLVVFGRRIPDKMRRIELVCRAETRRSQIQTLAHHCAPKGVDRRAAWDTDRDSSQNSSAVAEPDTERYCHRSDTFRTDVVDNANSEDAHSRVPIFSFVIPFASRVAAN